MSTLEQARLVEGEAIAISKAVHVGGYRLRLSFSNGVDRLVDFEPFLRSSRNPRIQAYLAPIKFSEFIVKEGDLMWGDYELCFPMADLYEGKI